MHRDSMYRIRKWIRGSERERKERGRERENKAGERRERKVGCVSMSSVYLCDGCVRVSVCDCFFVSVFCLCLFDVCKASCISVSYFAMLLFVFPPLCLYLFLFMFISVCECVRVSVTISLSLCLSMSLPVCITLKSLYILVSI